MKERSIIRNAAQVKMLQRGAIQIRVPVKDPHHYGCLTGDCPHERLCDCDAWLATQSPFGLVGDRLRVGDAEIVELTEDARAERVQTISESDARAEGITDGGCLTCGRSEPCRCDNPRPDARDAYIHYWDWDASYADKGYAWITNPWTWVVKVRRVEERDVR